ncbi:hypothetical protein KAX97_05305 [candidate division WOR-3 bacterium]|nr:hypothetical protein [candidate division WOR-3 bacterium]
MKTIIIVLLMLCYLVSGVSALNDTYYNTTFIHTIGIDSQYTNPDLIDMNNIGGKDIIVPLYAYNDTYFILRNDGSVDYMIYMYDYSGTALINGKTYLNSFCGIVKPGAEMLLINDASYKIYASNNVLLDITNIDEVKSIFNSYWLIGFVVILLITLFVIVIRKVIS